MHKSLRPRRCARDIIEGINKKLETFVSASVSHDSDLEAAIKRGVALKNQEDFERRWYR